MRAFVQKHPVLTYFVLAFALSWGAVLLVVGPSGIPATLEESERLFPLAFLAMLVGPSVAGLLLTGLVHGRRGLRELRSRLLRWRVGARWYAVALLTAPLVLAATLFALSPLSSELVPGIVTSDDKAAVLLLGFAVALGAGFFEELGWTGFATPALRRRYGVVATGAIIGVLWAAWHFLVYFWGSGDASGRLSLVALLPVLLSIVAILPAFRVLMVWVYDRTGSLLVAMVMHASVTASTQIFMPPAESVSAVVTYSLALVAVLWTIVAVVSARKVLPPATSPTAIPMSRIDVGSSVVKMTGR